MVLVIDQGLKEEQINGNKMTAAGGPFLGTFNRGGFMPDMPGMPSFFVVEAKRGFFPSVVSTTELFKENARYTKCLSCIVRS